MYASQFIGIIIGIICIPVSDCLFFKTTCHENPERSCKIFNQGSSQIHQNFKSFKTPDFISYYGYPVEEHKITTDDKYILTYFRIPAKKPDAIPVLLMHGLVASSVQWLMQPPHKSLAFMLHEAGYDVWLANIRGTSYSLGHERLSHTMDLEYWDFSSYEIGKYDIPAAVDYILANSSHSSLYYIGHSMGGQALLIAGSLNPNLNYKIRTLFALSPCVYTGNTTNIFMKNSASFVAPYRNHRMINFGNRGQLIVPILKNRIINRFSQLCRSSLINCLYCAEALQVFTGAGDPCQTNYTAIPIIVNQMPDSTSCKLFSHSAQAILTGFFRPYDYGPWVNLPKYGRPSPLEYTLDNINFSVVMFWGRNDDLVVPKDISKTAAALKDNLKENIEVPHPKWTHLDFLFGIDADKFVYNRILEVMNSHQYG